MKGTIETPRVAKIAMSLVAHLFFDVMLTLEKDSSDVVFGKQQAIRKNMNAIQTFILNQPYSTFNIEILDAFTRDLEDPILVITFKNYSTELPDRIPLIYHIILDETYTTFEVYQNSLDGILLKRDISRL